MVTAPPPSSASGTNQPTRPTEPFTTVRTASPTVPGSCHQTAAATTTASPMRSRPTPSRRCSGSRSRAVLPIRRTTAPSACARPSHSALRAWPRAPKVRANGPRPLRTARGAGREDLTAVLPPDRFPDVVEPRVDPLVDALVDALVDRPLALVDDRARELPEPSVAAPELREPGGLDVRVGMLPNLRDRHIRPTHHTPLTGLSSRACRADAAQRSGGGRHGRTPRCRLPPLAPAAFPGWPPGGAHNSVLTTFAARSTSARDTSRWVTIRSDVAPTAETRTPSSRAAVTTRAGSPVGTTTMLVSTVVGSTPHASARSRAWTWSSASRSTWWSST